MATRYGIFSAGNHNYSSTATWSSTADGLTTPASAPTSSTDILPSAIIANGATLTIDTAAQSCLSIDMSSVAAYAVTLAMTYGLSVYGSIDTTGMTITNNGRTLWIRNANGTTANVNVPQTVNGAIWLGNSSASTGVINLLSNLSNAGAYGSQLGYAHINFGSKTLTTGAITELNAQARNYDFETSTINCTSWTMTATNLTLGANTATINISGTGALAGGAVDYNGASFIIGGTNHTVSGNFTCATFALTSGNTQTITVTAGNRITCITATLSGDATHQHTIKSGTAGTLASIWATNKTDSYVTYTDMLRNYNGVIVANCAGVGGGTFAGAGGTFTSITIEGSGNYPLTITGDNIFTTFTVDRSQAAKTVLFTDGSNQTVTSFVCRTVGTTVVTLNGTGVAGWSITMAGAGILHFDYMAISYCTGLAASKWYYGQNCTMTSCTNWTAITYRYWVGNTGSTSQITHWSTASGGAGGVSVPDTTVAVRFDVNSITLASQTITVDANFNFFHLGCTGLLNTPSLAINAEMSCYESLLLVLGMTHIASAFGIIFKSLGTTTFTKQFPHPLRIQDGANITFLDEVDLTSAYDLTLDDSGTPDTTLNTNGQEITCKDFSQAYNGEYRYLTLGASIINCVNWNSIVEGCVLDAGTSSIRATSAFNSDDLTYYEVQLNGEVTTITGIASGTISFTNLIRNGTATKDNTFTIDSGLTLVVDTVCSLIGNSATNRLLVQSTTPGVPASLQVDGAWTDTENVDFMDITSVNPVNLSAIPGYSGDCGGNSGITLSTIVNQVWDGTTGSTSNAAKWTSRVPLPQDNVVIGGAGNTVTIDMPRIGANIELTGTPIILLGCDVSNYGAFSIGIGVTYDHDNYKNYYRGRVTSNWALTGHVLCAIWLIAPNGTLNLVDALELASAGAYTQLFGTLNITNQTVVLSGTGAGTKWDVRGGSVIAGGSTIVINNTTDNAQTFNGGDKVYGRIIVADAGEYSLIIEGNNTFNIIEIDASEAPKNIDFGSTAQSVYGFERDAGSNTITLTGSGWTITKLGTSVVLLDYLIVENSTAIPGPPSGAKWFAGTHSTDAGGNTGWIFDEYADLLVYVNTSRLTIRKSTLSVSMQLEQRTIAEFTAVDINDTLSFEEGQPVTIFEANGIKLFSGVIKRTQKITISPHEGAFHSLSCVGWRYLVDKRVAAESYISQSCGYIVADLVTKYLAAEGITVGEIQSGPVLSTCVINYELIGNALDKLAEVAGFIWYVDNDKILYFTDRNTYLAPSPITSADMLAGTVSDDGESPKYRNRQYKRGGKAKTDLQTEEFTGVYYALTKNVTVGYPLAEAPVSIEFLPHGG